MVKSEHKIQSQPSKSMSPSSSPSSPPSPNSYKKKFKGVRMRSWGSWVSEIRAPNQKTRIWLGSYSTPEAAARAYDAALLCLKGSSANLNFPINPDSLHIPRDTNLSPKSIQRVAAAAAANCSSSFEPVATNPPCQHPDPPNSSLSPSLTSASSSPSLTSSSFYNQIDDVIQLDPGSYYSSSPCTYDYNDGISMANNEHWYDFGTLQSPKYVDPLMSSMFFNPPPAMVIDDQLYEESDIRLWSFC